MQYVTSVERMGIAKGRQEGRREGRQEGWREGRAEAKVEMLCILLAHRFGGLRDAIMEKLKHGSEDQLKKMVS